MTARIKIRRDSAASWASNNPILAAGELGLDTTANQIKVGDGTTAWATLEFASGSGFDGTSDLVFQTEDLGFYAFSLNQYATWSQVEAVAMDSSAATNISDNIYAVGNYNDDDNGWQSSFVTKRNNNDTEAWTVSFRNSVDNAAVKLSTIVWDGVQDKLYVGGEMDDGAWKGVVLELDTTDGSILSQNVYTMPQGRQPLIGDMLIDQSDGSVILTGTFAELPKRVNITPVGNTNNPQGDSSNGPIADNNYSLLVIAKTDFTSAEAAIPDPNPNEYWRWYDQTNPSDGGEGFGEINQFRDLPTVTVTGTGSGARVRINYSIADNKWLYANHTTWENDAVYEYQVGDTIKIEGSSFGGADGTDDVLLTVNYVYNQDTYHEIGFARLDQQSGVNGTPPSVVTDYVRFWAGGSWNFASQIDNGAYWDVARQDGGNGFVLTDNFQIGFGDSGDNDTVQSADNYSSVDGDFIYVGVYRDTQSNLFDGKRAVVYKIDAVTGDQVWAKTVDMITDGTENGDRITSVNCDADGNVYVIAIGQNIYNNDVMIVSKLDADGNMLWQVQQDEGLREWWYKPKGDIDLNDGSFYIAGSQRGATFIKLNPANGQVIWARSVDLVAPYYNIETHYNNNFSQHVAVGRGRIAFAGLAYDYNELYNNGQRFGILMGLDANQISALSTNEVGSFGAFKLTVDNFHTITADGNRQSVSATSTQHTSTDISAANYTNVMNPPNNITLSAVDITRSPYKIENVQSITFADGSVQSTAGTGVKSTWKNPNNNIWKIVEWNAGKAVNYDNYDDTASMTFNAGATTLTGLNNVRLSQLANTLEWIAFDDVPNKNNERVYVGGNWYPLNGWNTDNDQVVTLNLIIPPGYSLPVYNENDSIQIMWDDPNTLLPVVWFDPSDSPYGSNVFRGAIIKYHAYTSNREGIMVGTIQYSYDGDGGQQEVTHSEHWSGNNDLSFSSFWHFQNGRLYYKNTIPDTENVLIQWTATMFYGNEANC